MMIRRCGWSVLILCLSACGWAQIAEDEPAISPQDLLAADVFPDASYGMAVEQADDGPAARVVTTGAEFIINKAAGTVECRQRIAAQRPVSKIQFANGTLAKLKLTHESTGAAIFTGGGSTLRINGDSLLMVQPAEDGEIAAELLFTPDYFSEFKGNYNFFDPRGGISFFEHARCPHSSLWAAADPIKVTWPWKGGDVFWAGVSPPKPFDWKASTHEQVVVYGSSIDRFMYPSDMSIARYARFGRGTILYLHCENLWKHWQLELVPRDMENYLRVMRTAHENGMKTIVYASPKLFLKGTVIEHLAKPDVNQLPPGWHTGSNAKIYLEQAKRIVKEFETDGLYFDEIYTYRKALAASYFVARSGREIVGPHGPLFFHSTEDTISDRQYGEAFGRTHCPAVHAYFTLLYKGEGVYSRWDRPYTRYIVGTYNISNTMATQMFDDRFVMNDEKIDFLLKYGNIRFFMPDEFFYLEQGEIFRDLYWPRMSEGLQADLEPTLLEPTGQFDQFRQSVLGK